MIPCVPQASMCRTSVHESHNLPCSPQAHICPQASMCPISVPQASICSSPSFHVPLKLPIAPQASMCQTSLHVPPKLPCTSKHPCAPQASKKSPELTTTTLNFLIPSYIGVREDQFLGGQSYSCPKNYVFARKIPYLSESSKNDRNCITMCHMI